MAATSVLFTGCLLALFVSHPQAFLSTTSSPRTVAGWSLFTASNDVAASSSSITTSTRMGDGGPPPPHQPRYDTIISGGGPAGLLTAIMLSQKFGPHHSIALCERRPAIPPSPSDATVWDDDAARSYCLGIGHRGQRALQRFGVYDDFVAASVAVNGRRDWRPGKTAVEDGRITPAQKDVVSRILPRDKLVGVLYHHLVDEYIVQRNASIDLLYGYEVNPTDFGTENNDGDDDVTAVITKCEADDTTADPDTSDEEESDPLCDVGQSTVATTKLLIGADGSSRTVANAMQRVEAERRAKWNPVRRLVSPTEPFRVRRFTDDNPRVYKSVPIRLPADWPCDLNYSARSTDNRITLEALPSDDNGHLCALLLMRPDDALAQPHVNAADLRAFFEREFPQFSALIPDDEMDRVALKPASSLPAFRYAGPRLNTGKRTLVLGDAAHTVKPYYGLGANAALEDVRILAEVLEEVANATDPSPGRTSSSNNNNNNNQDELDSLIPRAVQLFSKRRAADSQALVTISRNMDRPGKMFYVNFLIPLILDGVFHKMAPAIFAPNMFKMFQRQDLGFKQIQRKKRLDRLLQLAVIGSLLTGVGMGAKAAIGALARWTGQSHVVVTGSLAMIVAFISILKKTVAAKEEKANA